jgi:hypothetical protein
MGGTQANIPAQVSALQVMPEQQHVEVFPAANKQMVDTASKMPMAR